MVGPGKYDDLASIARIGARARAVIVIVIDGNAGSGFSCQAIDGDITRKLPDVLRSVASQIEADLP